MKKKLILFILYLALVMPVYAQSSPGITVLNAPTYSKVYDTIKVDLQLPYITDNPNDTDKIKVSAIIITPGGEKLKAPLFCVENIKAKGSLWQLRFTPVVTGRFNYYFDIEKNSLKEESGAFELDVMKSDKKGFLRRSQNNPYYLVFDSGEPYFGIGHNVAWAHNNSLKVFERYFDLLAENGGNLSRVWICSWSFPLEWNKLGEYDPDVVEKLDKLIEIAEKKGIYLILSLDTYGSLMTEDGSWNEQNWINNPYNKKNGGPCEDPEEFFRNKEAIKHYKNKLRYILARWGYSPNIMAIELWNEYNAPLRWIKKVTSYIGENDCHRHLITTSHGYPWGKLFDEEAVWKLDQISLITEHVYASSDENGAVPILKQVTRNTAEYFNKPFIVSEFGIDASKNDKELDPAGIGTSLHNSLWVTALSKSFGTAMNWWWDSYIRPKNLYSQYKALDLFLVGVDWDAKKVEYVDISSVKIKGKKEENLTYRYVRIKPEDKWGKAKTDKIIISNEGEINGLGQPNKYLHGMIKNDIKTNHVFNVNYPVEGEFIVRVGKVSQGAHLYVYLDGTLIKDRGFPTGEGEGPWKRSFHNKKYDIYQCVYNDDFKIKVPAGKHIITLENKGLDWMSLERITLTNYMPFNSAKARCFGLEVGKQRLLWIQNMEFNWHNTFQGKGPNPIDDSYFYVNDIKPGTYNIEWWDTFKGEVISREKLEAKDGRLFIEIPSFFRDIACKIKEA